VAPGNGLPDFLSGSRFYYPAFLLNWPDPVALIRVDFRCYPLQLDYNLNLSFEGQF
jgi:hypothetical protein